MKYLFWKNDESRIQLLIDIFDEVCAKMLLMSHHVPVVFACKKPIGF
jgi:hypothetical protein